MDCFREQNVPFPLRGYPTADPSLACLWGRPIRDETAQFRRWSDFNRWDESAIGFLEGDQYRKPRWHKWHIGRLERRYRERWRLSRTWQRPFHGWDQQYGRFDN